MHGLAIKLYIWAPPVMFMKLRRILRWPGSLAHYSVLAGIRKDKSLGFRGLYSI